MACWLQYHKATTRGHCTTDFGKTIHGYRVVYLFYDHDDYAYLLKGRPVNIHVLWQESYEEESHVKSTTIKTGLFQLRFAFK